MCVLVGSTPEAAFDSDSLVCAVFALVSFLLALEAQLSGASECRVTSQSAQPTRLEHLRVGARGALVAHFAAVVAFGADVVAVEIAARGFLLAAFAALRACRAQHVLVAGIAGHHLVAQRGASARSWSARSSSGSSGSGSGGRQQIEAELATETGEIHLRLGSSGCQGGSSRSGRGGGGGRGGGCSSRRDCFACLISAPPLFLRGALRGAAVIVAVAVRQIDGVCAHCGAVAVFALERHAAGSVGCEHGLCARFPTPRFLRRLLAQAEAGETRRGGGGGRRRTASGGRAARGCGGRWTIVREIDRRIVVTAIVKLQQLRRTRHGDAEEGTTDAEATREVQTVKSLRVFEA